MVGCSKSLGHGLWVSWGVRVILSRFGQLKDQMRTWRSAIRGEDGKQFMGIVRDADSEIWGPGILSDLLWAIFSGRVCFQALYSFDEIVEVLLQTCHTAIEFSV